jgi:2-polyprenyl-3-methyl-5-hydroxy-6-metoxy-1,4-benzoquinol methylase
MADIRDYRFHTPGHFRVLRCSSCGVGFTDPVPPDIGSTYPPTYGAHLVTGRSRLREWAYEAQAGDREPSVRLQRFSPKQLLVPLLSLVPRYEGQGRLLDVGCGSGQMLRDIQRVGWKVQGVEIDADAVQRGRRTGLSILHGSFEDVELPPESFDVVRMHHVLEHTHRPAVWLRKASEYLRPGGLLLIGVPNMDGAMTRAFGRFAAQWDIPRHLCHFTASTILRLLAERGYSATRTRFHSFHSDAFPQSLYNWLRFGRGVRVDGLKRLTRYLYLSPLPFFSVFLDSLGVGDNIEVAARKAA